jgi:hypothetical protein
LARAGDETWDADWLGCSDEHDELTVGAEKMLSSTENRKWGEGKRLTIQRRHTLCRRQLCRRWMCRRQCKLLLQVEKFMKVAHQVHVLHELWIVLEFVMSQR